MTSPIRPLVGSQSNQKTMEKPKKKKKNLNEILEKNNNDKTTNKAQTKCQ